jgi:sigma-B regulation protein RsbU (phosphoserine phosphatase)
VAQDALGTESEEVSPFHVLVDDDGLFQAILSSQDLANYMSRITQDDIELAAKLQERLQDSNETIGGENWSFEAWSRPAKGIGGDFYFTRHVGDGRVFLTLCDVSGKGVAASLVVSMTWGMLRVFDLHRGLGTLVRTLNESIVNTFHMEKYLTGFFALYDPTTRELAVADMGHSHAFLFRGSTVLRPRMQRGNLPIGIDFAIDPAIGRWNLKEGDRLFVFSDGLTEQENSAGEEFGERRLTRVVSESIGRKKSLHAVISREIDSFRGRTPQQDDMSFMLLRLDRG